MYSVVCNFKIVLGLCSFCLYIVIQYLISMHFICISRCMFGGNPHKFSGRALCIILSCFLDLQYSTLL